MIPRPTVLWFFIFMKVAHCLALPTPWISSLFCSAQYCHHLYVLYSFECLLGSPVRGKSFWEQEPDDWRSHRIVWVKILSVMAMVCVFVFQGPKKRSDIDGPCIWTGPWIWPPLNTAGCSCHQHLILPYPMLLLKGSHTWFYKFSTKLYSQPKDKWCFSVLNKAFYHGKQYPLIHSKNIEKSKVKKRNK